MKKLGMVAVTVALSGILVGTSVVSASVPTEFNELQTWHTSGMTMGTLNAQTLKDDSVTEDIVQNRKEDTVVVNPSESITNDVVVQSESVVETTPEYVAPPVVETAPEYVAPPVVETTPESVAPPVNEGNGVVQPDLGYLEDVDWDNPTSCDSWGSDNPDYWCTYE